MSMITRTTAVVAIAAAPKANLLPPEVSLGIKAKALRRTLVLLIVLVVVLVVAGVLGSSLVAVNSAASLAAANQTTADLLAEQAKYSEVRQVTGLTDKAVVAREVGMSTEINWKTYIAEIQASLPAGTVIETFDAEGATPTQEYSLPSAPLQGERIGQLTFTASSQSLPDVEAWLIGLSKVTGFVDANPGSVILEPEAGDYTVSIVMHINSAALSNRFSTEETEVE